MGLLGMVFSLHAAEKERSSLLLELIGGNIMITLMVFPLIVSIIHSTDYWQTMHGVQASFTHSLPVKARSLFVTKAVSLLVGLGVIYLWHYVVCGVYAMLVTGGVYDGLALLEQASSDLILSAAGLPAWAKVLKVAAVCLMPLAIFSGLTLGCAPNFLGGTQRWQGDRKQIISGRPHPVLGVSLAMVWTALFSLAGFFLLPVAALSVRGEYSHLVFGADRDASKYAQVVPTEVGVELLGGYATAIVAVLILCWCAV